MFADHAPSDAAPVSSNLCESKGLLIYITVCLKAIAIREKDEARWISADARRLSREMEFEGVGRCKEGG